MKKILIVLLIATIFTIAAPLTLAQTSEAALSGNKAIEVASQITDIGIKGNFIITSQQIKEVIFSKVGESLLDQKVNQDLKAIYALGYFADVSVNFVKYKKGTKIIFTVEENPLVVGIRVTGNLTVSTTEVRSIMETKPGRVLNYRILQSDIKTINQYFKDAGYILSKVTDVELDEKSHILYVKIVEGVIESIAIEGNDLTLDHVILRELKTKPGEVLNETVLSKDLKALFNLGFFESVVPNFLPGSSPDKIALVIKVTERRVSSINFGGGYGEREGWFGFIDLSINNLFGTGRSTLIRAQSGQELSTYQFKYSDPWFFPDRLGDHTSFTYRRWYTIGTDVYLTQQDEIHNGWDIELGKPLWENFRGSVIIGSEKVDPYSNATFEAYLSDSIAFTLSYDTRDYWLNPTEGELYTFSIKEGWKYTSSVSGFTKLGLDLNRYIPLAQQQVLAFHVGTGIGLGDIPIGEVYWCGSGNTVRGYYPTEARTGTRKLIANTEYRYTFNDVFQGVFFFDWGNAWDDGFIVPSNFLTGWGPGIRLNTPLGPIRLDYGVPSGANFGQGIIHFSIGQAF